MARAWHRVRVRVCLVPPSFINGRWERGKYIKKSKFYLANGPKGAAELYKGPGQIMNVQKVSREKLSGVGEFFTLGDQLLKEFKKGGPSLEQVAEEQTAGEQIATGSKEKRRKRFFSKNLQRGLDATN